VFTVKFDYDSMVEWVKNILPEENRLKENFYTVKSIYDETIWLRILKNYRQIWNH
jgi:hypothetical protein